MKLLRLAILGLFPAMATATMPSPTMIAIPPLPGFERAYGNAVSADGTTVVGNMWNQSLNIRRAFRWRAETGAVLLEAENPSFAYGVSGDGSTVVGFRGSSTAERPVRWDVNGNRFDVDPNRGRAYAISSDGRVIVGVSSSRAARWKGGAIELLGLGGPAYAVNDDGTVIVGGGDLAYRWTEEQGMRYVTNDSQSGASAECVSANGEFVGGYYDFRGFGDNPNGFLWSTTEGFRDVSTEVETWHVLGIRADGQLAVGQSGAFGAWIWAPATGVENLFMYLQRAGVNTTDWSLLGPRAMTPDGKKIAGFGSYRGQTVAFLFIDDRRSPIRQGVIATGLGGLLGPL